MTPTDLIRKGLVAAALLSLGACGMVESDPRRFEGLARKVADIRLSAESSHDAPVMRSAQETGLRQGLRVEVLDPHALWEARDGALRGMIDAAPAMAEAAAPVVARVVTEQVGRAVSEHVRPVSTAPASTPGAVIQLGAYSSESAAREAWTRFSTGAASAALQGLSPRLEPVEANGRRLVRLKAGPVPPETAAEICAAAQVTDPWCRTGGRA